MSQASALSRTLSRRSTRHTSNPKYDSPGDNSFPSSNAGMHHFLLQCNRFCQGKAALILAVEQKLKSAFRVQGKSFDPKP